MTKERILCDNNNLKNEVWLLKRAILTLKPQLFLYVYSEYYPMRLLMYNIVMHILIARQRLSIHVPDNTQK
jgi:hypothetical protein